jgi:phage terminase small subunit
MSDDAKLTPKQQRFVDEYLIDLNATQAAIRAGYSAKTANVIACENLSKPNIAAAIEKARQKTANKLEITRERVLMEFARLAFVDPRAFYNADGTLKQVTELDQDTAAALTGMEVDEIRVGNNETSIGVTRKIKWSDKRAALDSINRMMGWNEDKLKLQGDSEAPIEVKTKIVMVPMKIKAETSVRPLERDDG